MPTNVFETRKSTEGLFCNLSIEVGGQFVVFWVKFGFATFISVSPQMTVINHDVLLSKNFGFWCGLCSLGVCYVGVIVTTVIIANNHSLVRKHWISFDEVEFMHP